MSKDKLLHFAVSALGTIFAGYILYLCNHCQCDSVVLIGAALSAFAAGISKEYGDYQYTKRYYNIKHALLDVLADLIGITVGIILLIITI